MKILIAEDDTVSRCILEEKLVMWGYDVVVTRDGDEAWEALRSAPPPALAILDIMMPGIDGIELCRLLKEDPILRDIPVLFVSALTETEEMLKAFDAGGVDYITKPFAEREVLARVRTHLSLAAAKKELLRINRDLAREIEVRNKAEQKLSASEEMYASIFNNIGIGISLISPEMKIVSMNTIMKKWFTHIDVSQHPICYESFNTPPRDGVCNYCPTIHTLRDGEVHVAVSETPTKGGLRHYKIISSPLLSEEGSVYAAIEVVEDITEYKRAEQLNAHLASIVRYSDDAIITKSLEGVITSWNGGAERIYGYSPAEIVGRPVSLLIPPERRDEFRSFLVKVLRGESLYRHETVRVRKDGGRIDVALSISPIRNNLGKIVEISTIARDISEKKRDEEELLRMNAYNRSLIEASLDPMVTIGPDGLITDANAATTEVTGRKWSELVGSDFSDYFTDPDSARSVYQKVFRDGYVRDYPLEIRHRDGHTTPVLYNASVYRDAGGDVIGVFAAARDITEQKRAEEHRRKLEAQLQQAQKMEAIGTLAGCVAHDFNNILTAIIGYSDLIIMSKGADCLLRQHAEQIYNAAERAADLSNGLLAFSRKQVLQMRPVDICSIVREIERMLSRLVPEDIDLSTALFDKELIVMADKGQIGQVLMNLVTNAKDAMPKGGALTIDVSPAILDERFIHDHGFGELGKYACISVKDAGVGMDEDTRKRIFEPFFTTKEVGKGTGLGMSVVYGIVKQHKGFIIVDSEPGVGTTFRIYLPLIVGSTENMRFTQRMNPPPKGTETILLVEDDENVRTLEKIILENGGYTVITAADGRDALGRFMEHRTEVAILITDVVMPNIGGKQLCDEIRKIRPDVKVLFLSGYTKCLEIERDIPEEEFDFMAKPVIPSNLLKKVREILDSEVVDP